LSRVRDCDLFYRFFRFVIIIHYNIHSAYDALQYKYAPFIRKKSVVNRTVFRENKYLDLLNFMSG